MEHDPHVLPNATLRLRPSSARRRTCLLVPMRSEHGLGHALSHHLSAEIPTVAFTLAARGEPSAVWLCGYEPGRTAAIRALRERFGDALLLVTGRAPIGVWRDEAREAGADVALPWPAAYRRIEDALHGEREPHPLSRAQGF